MSLSSQRSRGENAGRRRTIDDRIVSGDVLWLVTRFVGVQFSGGHDLMPHCKDRAELSHLCRGEVAAGNEPTGQRSGAAGRGPVVVGCQQVHLVRGQSRRYGRDIGDQATVAIGLEVVRVASRDSVEKLAVPIRGVSDGGNECAAAARSHCVCSAIPDTNGDAVRGIVGTDFRRRAGNSPGRAREDASRVTRLREAGAFQTRHAEVAASGGRNSGVGNKRDVADLRKVIHAGVLDVDP